MKLRPAATAADEVRKSPGATFISSGERDWVKEIASRERGPIRAPKAPK